MSFFDSWALWQKMTFVLACAIVVTVSTALSRLAYTKRQLRHYAASAILESSALRPSLATSQPADVEAQTAKVPFGIRAIEAGIEVDGVWVSRSNTPASSRPSSPISPKSRQYPQSVISQGSLLSPNDPDRTEFFSSSNSVYSRAGPSLERPPAQRIGSASSLLSVDSYAAPSRSSGSNHDRVRGRSLPRDLLFLDLAEAATANFQRSPRHSFTRSPIQLPHPSPRLSTIIDEPMIELTENCSKHAAQESVETVLSLHTDVNTPNLSSNETTPDAKRSITSIETRSTELSLIEQHRLHQAASTGQLKPRHRPSSEEPFDPRLTCSPMQLPEIRVQAVPDHFEEQDLGLRRVESDSFSFVHGEPDMIDTRDFAKDVAETQAKDKMRKISWLVRPPFIRAKTEGSSSLPRSQNLYHTTTEQPSSTTAPETPETHRLRRVKKGLFRSAEVRWEDSIDPPTVEDVGRGETSNQPRTPKKLQKKQSERRERESRSSLRNVFYSAVGHSDRTTNE